MDSTTPCIESRANSHNLTKLEEEVLIYIEDIANYILESWGAKKIGKLWAYRFVKRYSELKICFNCVYDFQRALYEDPKLIEEWFGLVSNI
ncbi:hypothetical protein SS1G_03441 [Sclerotinia sclerotiorum 1980 UF-70]|uniref:HTH CENPB-type domain-containing protein n=1 Tax=Sclerotinia sclerotiorum (strain ATCC 18683 / 1980 / Ss-1) TaxID=665079 RepID=A7EDQ1_SCLS1|nr:hypothetical protein SS1G_03441 [Sclerotinia sclerotiorum 1980 UF-70]EDO00967.1 hypothetical protein SS1G_03441 [Sclerotinia sclerotiorum 1980 UF-70]